MKSNNKLVVAVGLFLTATFFNSAAYADENLWVYARGTDTRPEGSLELRLRDFIAKGKGAGKYIRHEIRPGVEYGVTDRLTVSATAMIFKHDYEVKNPNVNPMYETQGEAGGKVNHTTLAGYQLMANYNILSPYKDAFGFTAGVAYENRDRYRLDGANINQDSYIGNLRFQKNWLDDRLIVAFNFITELERRKAGEVLEEEIALEYRAGIAYRYRPKHFVGLEFRHQSDYLNPTEAGVAATDHHGGSNWDLNDARIGSNHQYGMYLGPTYHYAEQNWWTTVGALWQVAGSGSINAYSSDGKNWDEHERVHIGVSFGYEF